MKPTENYIGKVGSAHLTADEQLELLKDRNNENSRNLLIETSYGLCLKGAQRILRGRFPHHYDDMVSEGIFGVVRAIEKFDLAKNVRFSTYACWWIRSFQQRYYDQHVTAGCRRPDRWWADLQEDGVEFRSLDTPVLVSSDSDSFRELIGRRGEAVYVTTAADTLADTIPAKPEDRSSKRLDAVRKLLKKIPDTRNRQICRDRWVGGMCLRPIGRKHGISPERVRQITERETRRAARILERSPALREMIEESLL